MEGKVELSIERYEELTALERNIGKKLDEIDELKGKLVKDDAVLYRPYIIGPNWLSMERPNDVYEYKGRDEAIKNVVDDYNSVCKKNAEAETEIQRLKNIIGEYEYTSFSDRLWYLFTGKL